jgi:hypothetical protein
VATSASDGNFDGGEAHGYRVGDFFAVTPSPELPLSQGMRLRIRNAALEIHVGLTSLARHKDNVHETSA